MWDKKSRYEKKLARGEVLFREGDKGEEMYLIRSGKIKLSKGSEEEERIVAILKDGDFFGEMALIDGSPRATTATAIEDTSLMVIDKESFRARIGENPLFEYIIHTLTKRLRAANEKIRYLMIRNDERRVISYILARAKEEGIPREKGVELLESFSYDNLAEITGVSASKVEEYLKRLMDVGLISVEGDRLIIHSIPDLEEYIEYIALRDKFGKKG